METYPRYWSFVWGIRRSSMNSPQKRLVSRSFDIFFDLRLNKRLSWDAIAFISPCVKYYTGPLFTKRTGVLPKDLVKPRSREILCNNDRIALNFDRGISAVLLSKRLWNFRAIGKDMTHSAFQDFTWSCGKTSASLLNRVPVLSNLRRPGALLPRLTQINSNQGID